MAECDRENPEQEAKTCPGARNLIGLSHKKYIVFETQGVTET